MATEFTYKTFSEVPADKNKANNNEFMVWLKIILFRVGITILSESYFDKKLVRVWEIEHWVLVFVFTMSIKVARLIKNIYKVQLHFTLFLCFWILLVSIVVICYQLQKLNHLLNRFEFIDSQSSGYKINQLLRYAAETAPIMLIYIFLVFLIPEKEKKIKTRRESTDAKIPVGFTPLHSQANHFSEKVQKEHNIINMAHEDMKKSKIFSLTSLKLHKNSIRYICTLLGSNFNLTKLEFINCDVDSTFLKMLLEDIKKGKVETLNLSRNKCLDYTIVQKLMDRLRCSSLDLSATKFDELQEKSFGELNNVRKLILNYVSFPKTFSTALTRLLKNGLEELSLVDCDITCKQLEEIGKVLAKCQSIRLKALDLSHVKLDKLGLEAISKIINKSKTDFDKLILFNCGLNWESLKFLTSNLKKNINYLDIGLNEDIFNDGMQVVGQVKETIKFSSLETPCSKQPTQLPLKTNFIDDGFNEDIVDNGVKVIVDIIKKINARRLNLTSLSLESSHIRHLTKFSLKINDLNLCENPAIDAVDVGELVVKWKTRRLNISECLFSNSDFKAFAKSLEGHKLESLTNIEMPLTNSDEKQVKDILKRVTHEVVMK